MKKVIKIGLVSVFLVAIAVLIIALVISFKVVKQNTDKINANLNKKFQEIVRIPEIPPSYKGFYVTSYTWDMVTNQKEVTTVKFTHDTGFSRYQNKIIATLEMPQGADPSLFVKVMPAVVADEQALFSAQNLEDPKLGPNDTIGYSKIDLSMYNENSPQVTRISWEFDKNKLTRGNEQSYNKLNQYPEFLLRILYEIQRITLLFLKP